MVYEILILDAFGDNPGQAPPACAQRRLGIIIQNHSESSSVPFAVQNLSSPKKEKKKGAVNKLELIGTRDNWHSFTSVFSLPQAVCVH